MSSSQTCQANSMGVTADANRLLLEQTARDLPPNSIGSLNNKTQEALSFQSSDRDLRTEERTRMEPTREQVVGATLNNHPTGNLCEPNHGPTGPDNTNRPGALFVSENIISSNDSRASTHELFTTGSTNRTAAGPSEVKNKPSRAAASCQLEHSNRPSRAALDSKYEPLGDQLKLSSRDHACLAAVARKGFEGQMIHVPAEICQMIMDMIFEEAFGPRSVHPHEDLSIMNIFLALDRELYRKFHEQYWTKNTWIVSKGPLNKTMRFMTEKPYNESTTEFSLQIPNKAALQIQSIELSFSNADTPHLSEWHRLVEERGGAPSMMTPRPFGPITTGTPSEVQIAQRNESRMQRAQRYNDIQRQLVNTWQDKFDRVAMLNLRHLTLDFTEAYDPRGLYIGVNLVRRLIPFAHGMPADFKILAPDLWIQRQIRDAFLVLNAN